MKYVISNGYEKYAYSFTTDLLFSIASFNLSHDGIPRTIVNVGAAGTAVNHTERKTKRIILMI